MGNVKANSHPGMRGRETSTGFWFVRENIQWSYSAHWLTLRLHMGALYQLSMCATRRKLLYTTPQSTKKIPSIQATLVGIHTTVPCRPGRRPPTDKTVGIRARVPVSIHLPHSRRNAPVAGFAEREKTSCVSSTPPPMFAVCSRRLAAWLPPGMLTKWTS
ncbi:hypothetical protein E2562_033545 [Oryza meyeriana var. granulata]|uniref:Uncharacterized protein n=1 Tax=Oryza meyeriana var. granulata TaxID=110450 RepID=A0A6G1ES67_9ORYZ|nr:hypothetical protein E2562_033545 [Oryza meyeriana var. granulata]